MDALRILAEIMEPSERYGILRDAYIKLIKDGSPFMGIARSLLQAKYADKIPDLKLDLIRFAKGSDSRVVTHISDELRNLA